MPKQKTNKTHRLSVFVEPKYAELLENNAKLAYLEPHEYLRQIICKHLDNNSNPNLPIKR